MSAIASNLQAVNRRIAHSAQCAGRPDDSVRLVAVSKTVGAGAVCEAFAAGQLDFGENYVQEAQEKISEVHKRCAPRPDALRWHMIGPIQSNKTRAIAESFDWVHGVDRPRIAERLSEQRPAHLPPLNLCIQVNVSHEGTKSGVAPAQLRELAFTVAALPRVRLCGLMAIPDPGRSAESLFAPFAELAALRDELQAAGLDCPELSMGMSDDFEAAIAEGATMVRIGTAIFGARPASRL
jgi:pyridoxal phosphate enzyme (YggS family)